MNRRAAITIAFHVFLTTWGCARRPPSVAPQLSTPGWACFESPTSLFLFGDPSDTRPGTASAEPALVRLVLDSAPDGEGFSAGFFAWDHERLTHVPAIWEWRGDSVTLFWHDLFTTSRYAFVVGLDSLRGAATGTTDELVQDAATGALHPAEWSRPLRARRVPCTAGRAARPDDDLRLASEHGVG